MKTTEYLFRYGSHHDNCPLANGAVLTPQKRPLCSCGFSDALQMANVEGLTFAALVDALRLCQSALTCPPGNGAKEYQAGQAAKAALAHAHAIASTP